MNTTVKPSQLANDTMMEMSVIKKNIIKNLELEGECRIKTVFPKRRYDMWQLIIILLGYTLCTCVVGLLALKYSVKFRAWLLYSQSTYDEATHVLIIGNDEVPQIQEITIENNSKVFHYRKIKYIRDAESQRYYPIGYNLEEENHIFNQPFYSIGLTGSAVEQRKIIYGLCEHKVEIPTFGEYMFNELLKPFFILQYIICATYILQKNYQFAGIMLGFSIFTTAINYILLRLSYQKIKEIAEKTVDVQVLRDGVKTTINSSQLTPGDLFFPQEVIPCDCVLVKGQIYVNEASLTGQNIPIGKFPPANESKLEEDNCWLFEGAKLLQSRGDPMALVVNIGFGTRKGRIFRKILNNVPGVPEFFTSAIRFLVLMFVLSYIIYFALLSTMLSRGLSSMMIILRAFDIWGWAIPAAFPIYFNLCYSFSLVRLRRSNIFGTQPQKTVVSGKIKTMCFDKTGTLTLNSMDLYSIYKILSETEQQQIFASSVVEKDADDIMYKLFASCHTVRKIRDEFMGDQLDLRMYLFTGFSFELSDDVNIKFTTKKNNTHIDVLRINQFESKFQCMSVLVKDVTKNKYYVFVKGAPEKIQRASLNKYNKFDELVAALSLGGLRNIAFAYKQVSGNFQEYLSGPREDFEKNLTLLGVVGFENKLKHDTVQTIKILMDAQIQPKIITGDNIYIAVETALRTGMIPHESKLILLEGRKQKLINDNKYNAILLTHNKVKTTSENIELTFEEYLNQKLPMAIDNDFLRMDPEPDLPNNIKLFARISPESKALIVKRLKQKHFKIDHNHKVGMCGDGANDLMAIKEADVGMGISDTDSSFAANFAIGELKGVELIIREGKATLSNVIQIFRYYGCINFLKTTASMILIMDSSYFTGTQITFFNYSSTIWLTLFLALSAPSDTLSKYSPNDNFMGLENFLVYIGHFLIPTGGLILCYWYTTQYAQFYAMPVGSVMDWYYSSWSNTCIFVCIELMFAFNVFWIYVGEPFKTSILHNVLLSLLLIVDIIIGVALFFVNGNNGVLGMLKFDANFGGALFGLTLATIACGFLFTVLIRWSKIGVVYTE